VKSDIIFICPISWAYPDTCVVYYLYLREHRLASGDRPGYLRARERVKHIICHFHI